MFDLFGPSTAAQQRIANQFGTSMGSEQTKMLANQDLAFESNSTGVPNAPFDLKGLAKDMFGGLAKSQGATPASMATQLPMTQASVMQPQGMPQTIKPIQGVQGVQPSQAAMGAITSGMNPNSTFTGILQGLGYGR